MIVLSKKRKENRYVLDTLYQVYHSFPIDIIVDLDFLQGDIANRFQLYSCSHVKLPQTWIIYCNPFAFLSYSCVAFYLAKKQILRGVFLSSMVGFFSITVFYIDCILYRVLFC